MCLLIFCKGGHTPSKSTLRTAGKHNPDGFGFSVIGDNLIHTYKSMELEDTITEFYKMRDRYPKGLALFHLRIATGGTVDVNNCHPFYVSSTLVMGHNGILPIDEERGLSDTNLFATEWLPQLDVPDLLDTTDGMAELSQFASGSKLVFLNIGDDLKDDYYIVNEKYGHWSDGVWYSNYSYIAYTPPPRRDYTPYAYQATRGWEGDFDYHYGDGFVDKQGKPLSYVTPYNKVTPDDYEEYYEDTSDHGYQYRTWHANDCVYDADNDMWVHPDDLDEIGDLCSWECHGCGQAEMFDLAIDEVDYCIECGTCWFCSKPMETCKCDHLIIDDSGEF